MTANKLISGCDRTTVLSFYALIYFLPISTALVEMFSSFIITCFFVKRGALVYLHLTTPGLCRSLREKVKTVSADFRLAASPLNIPIGIFAAANILSVVFSLHPALSMKAFVFKLFQNLILFFAFVECMKTRKILQTFVTVYLVSLFLVVLDGLAQYFTGRGFIHGHLLTNGRVQASFNHPNDFGAYLLVAIPAVLSLLGAHAAVLIHRKKFPMIRSFHDFPVLPAVGILLVLSFFSIACLGLTFSRGAWAGFCIALVFMTIRRIPNFYTPALLGFFFIIVFTPQLATIRNVSFLTDNVLERQEYRKQEAILTGNGEERGSLSPVRELTDLFVKHDEEYLGDGVEVPAIYVPFRAMGRSFYWQQAADFIRQFPFFGTGLNTYTRVSLDNSKSWAYPHNCYLQMAAETGIIGLASFILICVVLFYQGLKFLAGPPDQFLGAVLLGTLAGLLGFLSHSFVDTNFYSVKLGSLLWIMMALIITIQKVLATKTSGSENASPA